MSGTYCSDAARFLILEVITWSMNCLRFFSECHCFPSVFQNLCSQFNMSTFRQWILSIGGRLWEQIQRPSQGAIGW